MLQNRYYVPHVLQLDLEKDRLWRPGRVAEAITEGDDTVFVAPAIRQRYAKKDSTEATDTRAIQPDGEEGRIYLRVRAYEHDTVRMLVSRANRSFSDESPMLEPADGVISETCELQERDEGWFMRHSGLTRLVMGREDAAPVVYPDGVTKIEFQGKDRFVHPMPNALALLVAEKADGTPLSGFSLAIEPEEHFCGTGERFDRMDLFGRQIMLINDDALGVYGGRAYKNIPFLMSSRPYGVFLHDSSKMKLDIGSYSKHSLQWLSESDYLDIFLIGGGSFQRILQNYRRLTGEPRMPAVWSFGVWMSRFTYSSEDQVMGVAERLRNERYPADVIHLDTGWFEEDWKCDWRFSNKRFPDPKRLMERLRKQGFRVSLWQCPHIHRDIDLSTIARQNAYVGQTAADRPGVDLGDTLDFTNPAAVKWYQGLLRPLLETGAAAIKADFGENIDEEATYATIEPSKYRNLFALLYQKAVWEVTEATTGDPVIWARSGWAGSQRYPVHWGGDCAATYDGMAGSLGGGLHLGLSGFAFWSHDCGGFHGFPDFMKSKPSSDLYVRWTQFGTFTSHMRYHGSYPHEPWEFPDVADIVRQWLRFRYSLLPYILAEAQSSCKDGLPLLRSLVIEWTDDPAVWTISDEYMFGNAFLVCPIMSDSGSRKVYLPAERWVDFWTGEMLSGPLLIEANMPLTRMPLYVRFGSEITFAQPVQCSDELGSAERFTVHFDQSYSGFAQSKLREFIEV